MPLVAIVANSFAAVAVIYWIYRARALYALGHPEIVAKSPATISQALADPAVGAPFSVWVTLSGLCLVFGVIWFAVFYRGLIGAVPEPRRYLRHVLTVGPVVVVGLQAAAAIGMYLLSSFRFPDHNETHMIGSYVFFACQVLVVMCGAVFSDALLRDRASLAALEAHGLLRARALRIRRGFGVFSVGLTATYLALFKLKDFFPRTSDSTIYVLYTEVEPLVIVSFLGMLMLFQSDLLKLGRLQRLS